MRAVVINSGNANACTGEQGHNAALEMTSQVASALGCAAEEVLVCSTGIIGIQLPLQTITAAIPAAVAECQESPAAFEHAAVAMMTTDTFAKQVSQQVDTSGGSVTVAGAAKGAAMIAPNMATMLAVVMTDASLTVDQCDSILRRAVDRSFNSITVDAHMSTSDTVLLLANGAVDGPISEQDLQAVSTAVDSVCEKLATDIIRDAEGASHFVTVDVTGCDSRSTAMRLAREVAESALVKTAIAGNDPNWGRITSAAGYAGVKFDPAFLSLTINEVMVYNHGVPVEYDEPALSASMSRGDVHLVLQLSGGFASGAQSARFWTSDLTQEYVRLNSEYTT